MLNPTSQTLCIACGGGLASYRYCVLVCQVIDGLLVTPTEVLDDPAYPHLHRRCERCGYEWLERCLGISEVEHV